MASSKLPAFQFYPGDWLKDPLLRACSLAARGLWMDLLCLMWDSPRRGYLMTGASQPYSLEQLARMVGCAAETLQPLLDELISVGVCSVKKDLIIYSRRVVRDEEKRAKDRLRQGEYRRKPYTDQQNCHADVTHHVTPVSQPSSSSSSSSSSTSVSGGGAADVTVTARRELDESPPLKPTSEKPEPTRTRWRAEALGAVRQMLTDWTGGHLGQPDRAICEMLLTAIGGDSDSHLERLAEWFRGLRRRGKHPSQIQSYGWFATVLAADMAQVEAAG